MVKTYLNEHMEGGAHMTTEFEVDLKQTLKAESNYSHWDKQSLNEVMTLIEPYWDSHELDIEEYIETQDRKSTRLNSSHVSISYAVFCLKKKKLNKKE